MPKTCLWAEDMDGNWWTVCGEGFVFTDSGPIENRMKYCCYCGNALQMEPHCETNEDEQSEPKAEMRMLCSECGEYLPCRCIDVLPGDRDPMDKAKADMEVRGER